MKAQASTSWPLRLWQRTTLLQRLAFVALMPTLITAALLVTILTRHQLMTLHAMGQRAANTIAIQTASVSASPMRNQQRPELIRIAHSVADLPDVAQVQIRSASGEILADARRPNGTPANNLTVERDIAEGYGNLPLGSVRVQVNLSNAIEAQHASLRNALIGLLLSLFVAGLIGLQAARRISAPLRHLAQAVHELGSGHASVEVAVTDHTEIGELQRGFNSAAAALLNGRREMEREIDQATTELARKNAALEAASVAKARFLAAASHDLRQPLYALTLFSSSLAEGEHDAVRLDRIAHIQECVEALDNLFSELLDLSRLETGAMQVEITEFPLDQALDEVSRNFRMIAEQHDLRLIVRPTDAWVRSDRTMLTRVLNNLVSNALHYTRTGGVLVGVRYRENGLVRVDVWDTGSGIAAEHQERVFDEFYRVEPPAGAHASDQFAPTHRGLGLGLATVQRLAEMLDTRVELASRPHRGTVFSFQLPRVPAGAAVCTGLDGAEVAQKQLDVAGMRVLVIDDEPAILSGVRYLLRSWGCVVATAEDRAHALELADEWPDEPDLVISDLRLRDGESGLDVLAALDRYYQTDFHNGFPRLLITGETRSDRLQEIRAATIPVLFKPVSPLQLRKTMASLRRPSHGAT